MPHDVDNWSRDALISRHHVETLLDSVGHRALSIGKLLGGTNG